jgi:drug/metabolite transporter (DMT)-like permease
LAFLAIYVIWGSTYLAIRFALETLPPLLMAGARFLVAGAILYAWARIRGAEAPQRFHWRSALIVGTLLFLGGNGGVVWAEQWVSSGLAALMIATEPIWIAVLTPVVQGGKMPSGRVFVGLAAGFGGVALLVGSGGQGGLDVAGAAILVVSALSWAVGSLYSPRAAFPKSQVLSSAMTMLAGGTVLVVAGLLRGEASALTAAHLSMRSILSFAYLVAFGSIVAFSAYRWLLDVTAPSHVSTYAYVNPVVAVLLGWALAAEPITARTLLAGAIIVLAVVVIVTDEPGSKVGAKSPARRRKEGREPLQAAHARETVAA